MYIPRGREEGGGGFYVSGAVFRDTKKLQVTGITGGMGIGIIGSAGYLQGDSKRKTDEQIEC